MRKDSYKDRYSWDALGLYALTLAFEIPVIAVRLLVVWIVMSAALALLGFSTEGLVPNLILCLSFYTVAASLLAMFRPWGTGHWWRECSGGREPSERERLAYEQAFVALQENSPVALTEPSDWFVVDNAQPDASVLGDSLMLSSGLLATAALKPVLAHELGHLRNKDGRLSAALNRLVIRTPSQVAEGRNKPGVAGVGVGAAGPRGAKPGSDPVIDAAVPMAGIAATFVFFAVMAFRWAVRFAKGGLGLRMLGELWCAYWRQREYGADAYAAALGQGHELAQFLEVHALNNDHPVPFLWKSDQTHPPTELRIDRLMKAAAEPAGVRSVLVAQSTGPGQALRVAWRLFRGSWRSLDKTPRLRLEWQSSPGGQGLPARSADQEGGGRS